ncbi:MAG: phage tail tube protein [Coriobacteriia bacterium]|nr:phage tail tube protein [Coriobacteriia bacterium]
MPFTAKSVKAMGTSLTKKMNGTETTDWVVGSLTSIGEIGIEISEEDITTLDSPDQAKEYLPGDIDAGELSITGIIKKADDEQTVVKMTTLIKNSAVEEWTVKFPSGAKWDFKAFVKSFKTDEASTDGMVGFSGTLRISGLPVYTPSTP